MGQPHWRQGSTGSALLPSIRRQAAGEKGRGQEEEGSKEVSWWPKGYVQKVEGHPTGVREGGSWIH